MNARDVRERLPDFFVFDLEWIGDVCENPGGCKLWEIACIHVQSGESFHSVIMPALAGKDFSNEHNGSTEVPPISREFILSMPNVSLRTALSQWSKWIDERSEHPIMISHNSFKGDVPVLRSESQKCGSNCMHNCLFMDSLSYCRFRLRGHSSGYGISDLCKHFQIPMERPPHRALDDTQMLKKILDTLQWDEFGYVTGIACTLFEIPMVAVNGIGSQLCRVLDGAGVGDVWSFYDTVLRKRHAFDKRTIVLHLGSILGNRLSIEQLEGIACDTLRWAIKLRINQ